MTMHVQFLPQRGRGTTEGGGGALSVVHARLCPSTTLRVVPLPVPGRNFA